MNEQIKFKRVAYLAGFLWIGAGAKFFYQHLFATLGISFLCLIWILLGFLAASVVPASFAVVIFVSLILSLLFPLTLAALTAYYSLVKQAKPKNLKYIWHVLWQSNSFRLMFIYILLVLWVALASSYLIYLFPAYEATLGLVMQIILAILEFMALIAIPANVLLMGKIPPFGLLSSALRGLILNFIPCLIFLVVFAALLVLIVGLAKLATGFLAAWSILIYALLLWVLVSWIAISSSIMSEMIYALK